METFIYKVLQSNEKAEQKIMTLGPYACALDSIIHYANYNRDDRIKVPFTVWRGLQMTND